jgi:hypothetical protein
MKHKKSYNVSEELYNKIVSAAYGEGSILDKIRIRYMAAKDVTIKKIFIDSKIIADAVHALDEELFPDELLTRVERKTISLKNSGSYFLNDFFSILIARPLVSTATSIVVIAAVAVTLFIDRGPKADFSNDEIVKADKQARYALAIVNKIFTQTNSTLKQEVLNDRVSRPFNDGYNFLNNLLEGEKR